jgi:predicted Zn-dependent peptidase
MAEPLGRHVSRERIEDLERPALDDRAYRIITLSNKLEVLLIHDAKTDKASASMDVNVGSFSDLPDMPGIAHAVEHLLFMGTEKVSRNCMRLPLAFFFSAIASYFLLQHYDSSCEACSAMLQNPTCSAPSMASSH